MLSRALRTSRSSFLVKGAVATTRGVHSAGGGRPARASIGILSNLSTDGNNTDGSAGKVKAVALAAAAATLLSSTSWGRDSERKCAMEAKVKVHPSPTPSTVNPNENFENEAEDLDAIAKSLPTYTSKQVAEHNGKDGKAIWMSYGGVVYDVTNFINNHPGGSERIMLAAGSAVEPYWHLYRQHFASDLPMRLMEEMIIGNLDEKDQEAIDEYMEKMAEENEDPYAHEPRRSDVLIVHGDQPMNAEVPADVLTGSYLTPTELFYIRHHHPVPLMTQDEIDNFKLDIDVGAGKGSVQVTMDDLKKLPKVEIVATLQCSGNRRGDMNSVKRTSGTAWSQGAISTAKWTGARLTDVLKLAGVEDPVALTEQDGIQKHVRFESLDGMRASIHMEKATNPYGDVIVAYEMNDEPLPRDHGFPLRVIVPGYAAVRNVKWVNKIEIASSEATGAWQQGLNYKTLPPNVTDAKKIDLAQMPSMTEVAVFSGITNMDIDSNLKSKQRRPGSTVTVKASGWAWSGGGRNIVRVDITGDGGESWETAKIVKGGDQKFGRAWAWVFWECDVPAVIRKDGTVQLSSKAVDLAFNSQPESVAPAWNVRGLGNNSWHSAARRV